MTEHSLTNHNQPTGMLAERLSPGYHAFSRAPGLEREWLEAQAHDLNVVRERDPALFDLISQGAFRDGVASEAQARDIIWRFAHVIPDFQRAPSYQAIFHSDPRA